MLEFLNHFHTRALAALAHFFIFTLLGSYAMHFGHEDAYIITTIAFFLLRAAILTIVNPEN